jgi:hypothetical protein
MGEAVVAVPLSVRSAAHHDRATGGNQVHGAVEALDRMVHVAVGGVVAAG